MSSKLHHVVRKFASALTTGTPEGKPKQPFITTFSTGTVTAVSAPTCTVTWAADPSGSPAAVVIPGLSYMLTGRTPVVSDVVLVMQTEHQRIVVGTISH